MCQLEVYLFNKCGSLLTEHLIRIYKFYDKKGYSSNESIDESGNDNVNCQKKEMMSGYSLCRDNGGGSVKLPCGQHDDECHKASEEMYNLLLLMLTNNLNLSEMSGKNNTSFLNNLKDVVCQYTDNRFKELNKSIAELSKKINEAIIRKRSTESIRTLNPNSNPEIVKHNKLKKQLDNCEVEVQHKTILELMKVIENSDISTSGCTDLSFRESKVYKRN